MEKISSSSPSEPLRLSGSSVLHLRNGAELPPLIGPFDSLLLCNTAAGKLHLCKCHEEREEREDRGRGEIHGRYQGHANSPAVGGSRCQDEVPQAF